MLNSQLAVNLVFDIYVKSNDFNGILLINLSKELTLGYLETINLVKELVVEGSVSIQSSNNPHIIGYGHYDTSTQLQILEDAKKNEINSLKYCNSGIDIFTESHPVCVYPSPKYLQANRDTAPFVHCPYSLQLAFGDGQFKTAFFEIDVLERYFKDPR